MSVEAQPHHRVHLAPVARRWPDYALPFREILRVVMVLLRSSGPRVGAWHDGRQWERLWQDAGGFSLPAPRCLRWAGCLSNPAAQRPGRLHASERCMAGGGFFLLFGRGGGRTQVGNFDLQAACVRVPWSVRDEPLITAHVRQID